ncbi:septal ring lytic transglycosylase RlpA family protein [Pseudomonas sp. Marseille-QA0332]
MRRSLGILALTATLAGCTGHAVDPDGYDQTGKASWYGARHHGKRTASGEPFDARGLSAAHRSLAFGSRVRVTNLANQRSVVVRINDRGPHGRGRLIDLSRAAAQRIGMLRSGVAQVRVQGLSD